MPRKADVDAPVPLALMLPTSVRARLDLYLFSELEGRVPLGAYKAFFLARLSDYFDSKQLDLAPYGFEQGMVVRGTPAAIEALEAKLKRG